MNRKDKKYRGFNELYFVLYLMAVLLLLPEGKKLYDDYIVSEQNSVYIKSEKSSLNVRLKFVDGNTKIISADTVNVIYPVGKIDSVKYNFRIVNNNIINEIYSSNGSVETNAFEIIENNEGLVRFEWSPQKIRSFDRNFEVIVEADIYSLGVKEPKISSVRFAVNTFYIDDETIIASNSDSQNSSTSTENNNPQNNSNGTGANVQFALGDISFFPDNPVTAVATSKWNSVVRVFGIDLLKELKGLPKVKSNEKYKVNIEDINSNAIYLSGITSSEESYKVEVEIERNADNRIASTEFIVKPLLIQYPEYKKLMYPNYTYTIKSNLPKNNKSSVKLFYKDKLVANSDDGSNLEFIPQFSDTNKVFKLNRYIDGELLDSKQDLRVVSPSSPEITQKSIKDGYLYLTTKSYGKIKNGNNNIVSKLSFNKENIDYQDLNGQTQTIENYTIQVFRINIPSNISNLEIFAIDNRGEYSNKEKINF